MSRRREATRIPFLVAARNAAEQTQEVARYRCADYPCDADAAEAAIADLPPIAGAVTYSEGLHVWDRPVRSRARVTLRGSGRYSTQVWPALETAKPLLEIAGTDKDAGMVRWPCVRDMAFVGGIVPRQANGVLLEYEGLGYFDNVAFVNLKGYGVQGRTAWNTNFHNCVWVYCGDEETGTASIYAKSAGDDSSNNWRFVGCDILGYYWHAVHLKGHEDPLRATRKVTWQGGVFHGVLTDPRPYAAVLVDGAGICRFSNVNFTNGGAEHVLAQGRASVSITDCDLDGAGRVSHVPAVRYIDEACGIVDGNKFGQFGLPNRYGDLDYSQTTGQVAVGTNLWTPGHPRPVTPPL